MAKKIVKMNSLSTNVRYIKARQRGTHFLLTALWHLSPNATKDIILNRFFKPTSYALTPLERQFLENSTSFHIHVHDKDIRCWKWGRGPGMLFVHGWNGRGINFAYFFKPFIDAGYSIITYDAPAHGESEGHVTNYFELSDTDSKILSEKTDNIFLHTTEGLGHKRILRDNAVVDVITSYIFNGQLKHDDQLIKNVSPN
jgi:hypothetical protein